MTATRPWLRRVAPAVLPLAAALAAAVFLGGCEASSRHAEPLPSLRDIRREHRIPPEVAAAVPSYPVQRTPLRVDRADFPLDDPLSDAWALLDTSGLSPAISGAWRVNGIRVGVLKAGAMPLFVRELPQAAGGKSQIVVPTTGPMPLVRSPRLNQPVAVDLTVPPRPVREIVLSSGGNRRIQLLVEVVRDAMNRPVLILTPHQHVPQLSLEVRTAEEKQLDGRILDELSLAVLLHGGEALVLGVDVPPAPLQLPRPPGDRPAETGLQQAQVHWPAPAEPQPGEGGGEGDATGSAELDEPGDEPAPAEDRLGPNLGRALFAASRYHQPIQMIYIIRIAE